MGQAKIGAKIVLEGESEYRNALKNINAAQKENRSEMKLWSTEFKENQNCTEALTKKYEILTKQLEIQKQKVEENEAILSKNTKAEEKAAEKVKELETAYNSAVAEMKQMKDNSDTTSEALEEQKKKVDELKGKLELAESGYDATTRKVAQYKTSLNYAQAEQRAMETELSRTGTYLEEAKRATDGNATSIDRYGKEVQEATEETSVFGDVLKANLASEAIKTGITKLAEGIKQIAESATETGESFEAAMSQVAATMGMTADEVENGSKSYVLLADAAKKCGAETKFSATEAGEALNYLALAGYDAEKAAVTLPKVLDLAAAGGLDLAYASDLVTDSMASMSMETSELDNYIDEMARTSQKSNTSVAQLGEATLVCAGTVSLAGQSLETMNTELGVLANNGIKGAEGGTHLRNIILSLSAPTDTASEAIQGLGLRIADSQGNMRDLNDIMVDLNASLSGMSSTEKTQAISKIFNKTDIAAVNALLKGTGDEYNKLNAEIKSCSGAASDMAKTLNNNLKGRVDELESALEGLGISAYEIFDDDMKKSVESATKAVGNLQKSIDNGKLGVSLNKMAEAMGEFAGEAIGVGEDVLPVVIDGFTWILDNSDLVISGVAGIAAANMEMKVVAPAVEAVTTAWNTYKTANEGATVSQWLLNTAMNANPAGLLVTAVVGLTAAVGAYVIINKDNLSVTDEVTKKNNELIKASQELNDTLAASQTERESNRQSMEKEAGVCQNLVKELKELQAKTGLTASEQARQRIIVDQLNEALPELNIFIDEQTGKLNKSTDAIEDNVDAMLAMAKAEAAREDLIEIAEQQYEAEKQLAELESQREEQTKAVTAAQEELNDVMTKYDEIQAKSQLQRSEKALAELDEQIKTTQESIDGFTVEYAETMEYIENTEELATATAATQELGNAAETTGEQIYAMSTETQQAYQEMSEDLYETISSQMSLFTEFEAKSDLSTQKLLSNMESQITGLTEWSDNIKVLADRGIDQGLLKTLADMGPEGAGYVATFVSMTDEELQKANDLYQEAMTIPDETTNQIMESFMEAGNAAGESYEKAILGQYDSVAEASEGVGSTSIKALKDVLKMKDSSEETHTIGLGVDYGLSGGIKDGTAEVLETAVDLCTGTVKTTEDGLQSATFETIGKSLSLAIAAGIKLGEQEVTKAVQDMCTAAVTEANKGLSELLSNATSTVTGSKSASGSVSNYASGWESTAGSLSGYVSQQRSRIESSGYAENATVGSNSFDYSELKNAVTEAVESGMSSITFNINANADSQRIVEITVEANNEEIRRTGRSLYEP